MNKPYWHVSDNRNSVILTVPSEPDVEFKMDAEANDSLIAGLGMLREHMVSPIAAEWKLGQQVDVIPDPRWAFEPGLLMGNSVLHLRNPRLGWLHYLLPREQARKLAQFLLAHADAPPPGR